MKLRALLMFACLLYPLFGATTPSDTERRIAVCLLALGRKPAADDERALAATAADSAATMFERWQQRLRADRKERTEVAQRAFQDAFGEAATAAELATADEADLTYVGHLARHLATLRQQPERYARVIDRAYQHVIRRTAYDVELEYWRGFEALPFSLLIGCIEGWARRNAPGLMATTGNPSLGVSSAVLETFAVSPETAEELRSAIGLSAPVTERDRAAAAGRNVILPGGQAVNSLGGMHLIVVGRDAPAPR